MTTASMSVQDALWLTMDRPNNLMVVDGSMVLRGVPSMADVNAVLQEAVERFPVLGRRARATAGDRRAASTHRPAQMPVASRSASAA